MKGLLAIAIVAMLALSGCSSRPTESWGFSIGEEVKWKFNESSGGKMLIRSFSKDGTQALCAHKQYDTVVTVWCHVSELEPFVEQEIEEVDEIDLTRPEVVVFHDGRFKTLDWHPTLDGNGRLTRVVVNDKDFIHRTPDFTVEKPKLAEVPEKSLGVGDTVQHKLSDRTPRMLIVQIRMVRENEDTELASDENVAICRWVDSIGQVRTENLYVNELVRYVEPATQEAQFAHLVMPETLE
jgi:uncharacterized protein YodC (DUF2158 family)